MAVDVEDLDLPGREPAAPEDEDVDGIFGGILAALGVTVHARGAGFVHEFAALGEGTHAVRGIVGHPQTSLRVPALSLADVKVGGLQNAYDLTDAIAWEVKSQFSKAYSYYARKH